MKVQNISNIQRNQHLAFKQVYRVEDGHTYSLFAKLQQEGKSPERFAIGGLNDPRSSLILVDGKDDIDATSYKKSLELIEQAGKKQLSDDKANGVDSYFSSLRFAKMDSDQKGALYAKYSKKTIVITAAQFQEILDKGFDAVASKLRIKR